MNRFLTTAALLGALALVAIGGEGRAAAYGRLMAALTAEDTERAVSLRFRIPNRT